MTAHHHLDRRRTGRKRPPTPDHCAQAGERVAHLLRQLRAAGGRRTALRARVLQILADCDPEHLTINDICRRTGEPDAPADFSGIYRALSTLTDCGITHTLATTGPPAYGLSDRSHHHAICRRCGIVVDLGTDEFTGAFRTVAATVEDLIGFRPAHDGITVHGLCAGCRSD